VKRLTRSPVTEGEGVITNASPSFSPDGRLIAFSQVEWDHGPRTSKIWTMRRDGSNKRQLHEHEFENRPLFAPDGRIVYYGYKGRNDVYSMSAKGKGVVEVPGLSFYDEDPAFAPDMSLTFFADDRRDDAECNELYSVAPDGVTFARLTATEQCESDPVVSPDGQSLAFVSHSEGPCGKAANIYVANLAVTAATPIAKGCAPDWATAPAQAG
jgi:dipeptidyl aminopeptidase/acylaminoacyl peptidase